MEEKAKYKIVSNGHKFKVMFEVETYVSSVWRWFSPNIPSYYYTEEKLLTILRDYSSIPDSIRDVYTCQNKYAIYNEYYIPYYQEAIFDTCKEADLAAQEYLQGDLIWEEVTCD